MKKAYEIPTLSLTSLSTADVIRTSGDAPIPSNKKDYSGEWDKEM